MANLGTAGQITNTFIPVEATCSIINLKGYVQVNPSFLKYSGGKTITMVRTSRLFLATKETTGNGENLTKETFQYWG